MRKLVITADDYGMSKAVNEVLRKELMQASLPQQIL